MTKKIRKIQVFRHITQVILFFLLPGLYALSFNEFKKIYEMIIDGNFHFIQAFPSLMEFMTVIILTMLLGRFFCGWLCAFGTYNDWVHLLGKNVFKINFKVNEKVDSTLKYVKYVVLLMILIVVCTMESNIFNSTSPWDAFAQITDISYVLSDLTIGIILLVLITIGAFFIERFFCRYLCPLGAIFSIVSKVSIFKIKKPNDKCGKCRICTSNCSMGLQIYKVNNVRGGECINCLKCVDVCPRNNAQANVLGENVNPALASSVAIAAFAGIYGLNNFAGTTLTENGLASTTSVVSSSTTSPSEKYKDGTYTGNGTGFRGGTTTIAVTISNGKISDISTISQQDTPDFYEGTIGTITNEIISAQSTSVDTVSGATFSSKGIIEAVQDALNQALEGSKTSNTTTSNDNSNKNVDNPSTTSTKEDSTSSSQVSTNKEPSSGNTTTASNNSSGQNVAKSPSSNTKQNSTTDTPVTKTNEAGTGSTTTSNVNNSTSSNTTNSDSTKTSTSQQQKYKDGTYTGAGTGFRGGTTEISVTIKGDKITNIETISTQDTPRYYDYAKDTMFSEITSAQSTSVDTVSGATYSSRGIMEAVENALSKAE